jgi:hypothetical protein
MPAPFAYHRLVVGYHGCDRSVGEEVLLRGRGLKKSSNRFDWLGEGIYFWEHGPERALEFAEWKKRRGELSEPFVLGAYIHLGQCFDLTDTFATSQLELFYQSLVVDLAATGQPLPQNKPAGPTDFDLVLRFLDCAVLNSGLSHLESEVGIRYDTVRGVFPEGAEAYPGAKILKKTHVQVAVRNPACLLGFFRPASYDP